MPPLFPDKPSAADMRAVIAYYRIVKTDLARDLGIDPASLYRRLIGKTKWRDLEIAKVREIVEAMRGDGA